MLWIPSWELGADAREGEVQHRYPPTKPAFSSIPALSYMGHGETGRHCDVLSDRIACSLGVAGGPETQYSPPGLKPPSFLITCISPQDYRPPTEILICS